MHARRRPATDTASDGRADRRGAARAV